MAVGRKVAQLSHVHMRSPYFIILFAVPHTRTVRRSSLVLWTSLYLYCWLMEIARLIMRCRSTYTLSYIDSRKMRRDRTIAASKSPPQNKPPLTIVDDLCLTYEITEGVAKNFQATLEFINGLIMTCDSCGTLPSNGHSGQNSQVTHRFTIIWSRAVSAYRSHRPS